MKMTCRPRNWEKKNECLSFGRHDAAGAAPRRVAPSGIPCPVDDAHVHVRGLRELLARSRRARLLRGCFGSVRGAAVRGRLRGFPGCRWHPGRMAHPARHPGGRRGRDQRRSRDNRRIVNLSTNARHKVRAGKAQHAAIGTARRCPLSRPVECAE